MASSEAIGFSVELPEKNKQALGQRRPRARLTIGEEETISIPVAVGRKLMRLKKEGMAFGSRAELLYKVREVSQSCAHDRMEYLINGRDYSAQELAKKLTQDGYHASVVENIVSRAQEFGIVDDRRFAESFIHLKLLSGWGRARIIRELGQKGISEEILEELDDAFPEPEDEAERAFEIASRRRITGKNDYQKIVRHLVSRGFSVSAANSAARRVLDGLYED